MCASMHDGDDSASGSLLLLSASAGVVRSVTTGSSAPALSTSAMVHLGVSSSSSSGDRDSAMSWTLSSTGAAAALTRSSGATTATTLSTGVAGVVSAASGAGAGSSVGAAALLSLGRVSSSMTGAFESLDTSAGVSANASSATSLLVLRFAGARLCAFGFRRGAFFFGAYAHSSTNTREHSTSALSPSLSSKCIRRQDVLVARSRTWC